jgi:hypothetical protein
VIDQPLRRALVLGLASTLAALLVFSPAYAQEQRVGFLALQMARMADTGVATTEVATTVEPADATAAPAQQPAPEQQPAPAQPGTQTDPGEGVATLPGEQGDLEDPPVAQELEANWVTMGETETHWYTFWHEGAGTEVHIWMDVEPNEGAGFRIYDEENAEAIMAGANPNDINEIGRGTRNEEEPGHLFWRGVFEETGPFYVMIEHGWQGDIQYAIYATGPGMGEEPLQAVE